MTEAFERLLCDQTRPPGIVPVGEEPDNKVLALTLETLSHKATPLTVCAMAKAAGMAASTGVKSWHDLVLFPTARACDGGVG